MIQQAGAVSRPEHAYAQPDGKVKRVKLDAANTMADCLLAQRPTIPTNITVRVQQMIVCLLLRPVGMVISANEFMCMFSQINLIVP